MSERWETAKTLSGEDRTTIVGIARQALARFQPHPEAIPKPETAGTT
jgi:hypothetical protein